MVYWDRRRARDGTIRERQRWWPVIRSVSENAGTSQQQHPYNTSVMDCCGMVVLL